MKSFKVLFLNNLRIDTKTVLTQNHMHRTPRLFYMVLNLIMPCNSQFICGYYIRHFMLYSCYDNFDDEHSIPCFVLQDTSSVAFKIMWLCANYIICPIGKSLIQVVTDLLLNVRQEVRVSRAPGDDVKS